MYLFYTIHVLIVQKDKKNYFSSFLSLLFSLIGVKQSSDSVFFKQSEWWMLVKIVCSSSSPSNCVTIKMNCGANSLDFMFEKSFVLIYWQELYIAILCCISVIPTLKFNLFTKNMVFPRKPFQVSLHKTDVPEVESFV